LEIVAIPNLLFPACGEDYETPCDFLGRCWLFVLTNMRLEIFGTEY